MKFKILCLTVGLFNISYANTTFNESQLDSELPKKGMSASESSINSTDSSTLKIIIPEEPLMNNSAVEIMGRGGMALIGDNFILSKMINVKGPFWSTGVIFKETVNVKQGEVNCKDCTFEKPVVLNSSHVKLDSTTIGDLLIKDTIENPVELTLINVQLNGKIQIESGAGKIMIEKYSKLSKEDLKKITGYKEMVFTAEPFPSNKDKKIS